MPRRSPQQWSHSLNNLHKVNVQDRENQDPRSLPTSSVQTELAKQRARADDNARKY